jgi:hypothetical protein
MNKKQRYYIIRNVALLFFITTSIAGCKTAAPLGSEHIQNKSTEEIIEQALAAQLDYENFSAKISADIKFKDQNNSIKATLRVRKDSAIWVSISPALGIEMFRLLCTKDSVKYVDKLKNQYFLGDYKQLNRITNSELNLNTIEKILVGNLLLLDSESKYRSKIENNEFYLATRNTNKLRKVVQADKNETLVVISDSLSNETIDEKRLQRIQDKKEDEELIVRQYWFNGNNMKATRTIFTDLASEISLLAEYSDFELIADQLVPTRIAIDLGNNTESANFRLSYSKVKLNSAAEMPFTIPEKYEQVFR